MLQGFLVALVATLIYMESRIGGQHMLDRPILIGPIVGLIMGDFTMGLIIGGNLELVWMGLVGIGTSTPPDVVVGSAPVSYTHLSLRRPTGPTSSIRRSCGRAVLTVRLPFPCRTAEAARRFWKSMPATKNWLRRLRCV